MDHITKEFRRKQWESIVQRCQERPDGQTAKDWLTENDIPIKSYYYWLRKFRKEAINEGTVALPAAWETSSPVTFAEIKPDPKPAPTTRAVMQIDAIIDTPRGSVGLSNTASRELIANIMEVMSYA